jgi:hypothetical protein
MKIVTFVKSKYCAVAQKACSVLSAPTQKQSQVMLFALGVGLLTIGLNEGAAAATATTAGLATDYNDARLADSLNAILTYIEGTFGAMVMVAAGIGAILSSAMGQYRAALGLLVVAVGAFILRSLIGTFFNDSNIQA